MKKEIRKVTGNIIQITTLDERWYAKEETNPITGIPEFVFYPSLTWVADCYPKGIGFYKWLADKGWDEAESIKTAGGERGSKVHKAIEKLLSGEIVPMGDKFINPTTEQLEELTLEEYECLMSWCEWYKKTNPVTLAVEVSVTTEILGMKYGCTIDWIGMINGKLSIRDWKTSQTIWPSSMIQLSGQSRALPFIEPAILERIKKEKDNVESPDIGIVQIGYKRNKNGYKETQIKDCWDMFKIAYSIWGKEHNEDSPKQRDYPLILKLEEKTPLDKPTIKHKHKG